MPVETSHNCPIDGCRQQIPCRYLMCIHHWRLVPQKLKRAVRSAFNRRWGRDLSPGKEWVAVQKHREAMQAAIDFVHGLKGEAVTT